MNSYKQVYKDYELWYNSNGLAHRTDGPAYSANDGGIGWYINGKRFYDNNSYQEAAGISDEDMIAMVLKYGDVK